MNIFPMPPVLLWVELAGGRADILQHKTSFITIFQQTNKVHSQKSLDLGLLLLNYTLKPRSKTSQGTMPYKIVLLLECFMFGILIQRHKI